MAQALRQIRDEAGMTRQVLADALGISAEHVKKIESGERSPSRKVMHRIADLFDLPFARIEAAFPILDPHQTTDGVSYTIRHAGSVPHQTGRHNARFPKSSSEGVHAD